MSNSDRRSSRSAPPARPAESSWQLGWKGAAALLLGGGLLARALLRGTAPSANSPYNAYRAQLANAPQMPPGYRRATPEVRPEGPMGGGPSGGGQARPHSHQQQPYQSQQQQQQQQQQSTSNSAKYDTYKQYQQEQQQRERETQEREQQEQQQREREYDAAQGDSSSGHLHGRSGTWSSHSKSAYAKYEEILAAERIHFEEQARAARDATANLSDYAPYSSAEMDFELGKGQARADYVQSTFEHLKRRNKKIFKYHSWAGTKMDADEEAEERRREEEQAARMGYELPPQSQREQATAYQAMQRQMATQPRFIRARQLLFDTSATSASPDAPPDAGSPAPSPFAPPLSSSSSPLPSSLPPLSVDSVRSAYFARAKLCHPDVSGGSREKFQRLTEAYEMLIDTLEPMERRNKKAKGKKNEPRPPEQSR